MPKHTMKTHGCSNKDQSNHSKISIDRSSHGQCKTKDTENHGTRNVCVIASVLTISPENRMTMVSPFFSLLSNDPVQAIGK